MTTTNPLDALDHSDLAAALNLPDDMQAPIYDGQSILNVAGTVTQLLGAGPLGAPPLRPELISHLGGSAKRVVVLLVDALAYHRLLQWLDAGRLPALQRLLDERGGRIAPLTSISPSTTAAVITTFWTGVPAAQHGITGNAISPTIVDTPMAEVGWAGEKGVRARAEIPVGRFATPKEVAAAALYFASADAGIVTGANLLVDGGFTAR